MRVEAEREPLSCGGPSGDVAAIQKVAYVERVTTCLVLGDRSYASDCPTRMLGGRVFRSGAKKQMGLGLQQRTCYAKRIHCVDGETTDEQCKSAGL